MHQILVATGVRHTPCSAVTYRDQIIAFVSGFVTQSVQLMMIVFAVGLVGTLLVRLLHRGRD